MSKFLNIIEVKEMGGLIQVNAGAVIGDGKRKIKKLVKKLFKLSLIDFVASDAHSNRTNCFAMAYALVSKKYGKETADRTFILNAKKIIGQA